MAKIVAHFRKVQTAGGLSAVAEHNQRAKVYDEKGAALSGLPDYISRPERAELNALDRCGSAGVHKRRSERIQNAQLKRKPQKNAAVAIEGSFSASPEWFDSHSPKEWKAYFQDCRKWAEKRFGKENILHVATHYDEKTPHMHILFVPIIESEKGMKYSSSEFLGGRAGLGKIQTEIYEEAGKKNGLERGEEGSEARHTNHQEWIAKQKKEIQRERKELEKEKEEWRDIRHDIVIERQAIKALRELYDQDKKSLEELKLVAERTSAIAEQKQKIVSELLKHLEGMLPVMKDKLTGLKKEQIINVWDSVIDKAEQYRISNKREAQERKTKARSQDNGIGM